MVFQPRDAEAVREDLLCAYLVLRELRDYGPHYDDDARRELIEKAVKALRHAWADTGAAVKDLEPQMLALLASGTICQERRKGAE